MGLPSNMVRSVDASDWMVYIGTDGGVVSYFDKNLYPVKKFESTPADVVRAAGGKIVTASSDGGILLKQGVAVKTLVEPAEKAEPEVFTQVEDEL